MRQIKQKARPARIIYGCSYCSKILVKEKNMIEHEKICYYNPSRSHCPMCGEGAPGHWWENHGGPGLDEKIECPVCVIWKGIQEAL